MKKYFLLAIILLCTMNSQAQIVNERNKERIKQTIKEGFEDVKEAIKQNNSLPDEHEQWDTYVVPKVGLNVSNMPGLKGNPKLGPVLGVLVEMFITKNLAMGVEVEYTQQGTSGVYGGSSKGPYSYSLQYFNTSYLVRWYPRRFSRWSLYTGLKTSQLLSSNVRLKDGAKTNMKDKTRNGDFFIPLGMSYEWQKWQIDMRYCISMLRLRKGDTNSEPSLGAARNNIFQVTIGYRFQVL